VRWRLHRGPTFHTEPRWHPPRGRAWPLAHRRSSLACGFDIAERSSCSRWSCKQALGVRRPREGLGVCVCGVGTYSTALIDAALRPPPVLRPRRWVVGPVPSLSAAPVTVGVWLERGICLNNTSLYLAVCVGLTSQQQRHVPPRSTRASLHSSDKAQPFDCQQQIGVGVAPFAAE